MCKNFFSQASWKDKNNVSIYLSSIRDNLFQD